MKQAKLFDDLDVSRRLASGPPAQRHSKTSVAAAESARGSAAKQRNVVLAELQHAGADGMTDEEIQWATWLNPSSERPRRVELVAAGLVKDSGRVRPTHSGRSAVVWVAVGGSGEGA